MDNKIILATIIGIVFGLLLYDFFLVPDVITKVNIVETIKSDTVYVTQRDTIKIRDVKYIYERDTIIENYRPKIRGFKEFYPTMFGNVWVTGEVLGDLRYVDISHNLEIPLVTNIITKEKTLTNTVLSKGIYIGGGINSIMQYNVSASYVDNKYLFQYQYQPQLKVHQIGVAKKLF
jgi:hypothetical protein